MKKPFDVPVLVGIFIAGVGVGVWMVFALNARPNHAPSTPLQAATEGPKGKASTVAVAPAASPVLTPAPAAEHYWYLTKVTGWSGSYGTTKFIGIAASFYSSSHDCESVKSRWAH